MLAITIVIFYNKLRVGILVELFLHDYTFHIMQLGDPASLFKLMLKLAFHLAVNVRLYLTVGLSDRLTFNSRSARDMFK